MSNSGKSWHAYWKFYSNLSAIQRAAGSILVASSRMDEVRLSGKDSLSPVLVATRNKVDVEFLTNGIVTTSDGIETSDPKYWPYVVAEMIAPTFDAGCVGVTARVAWEDGLSEDGEE